MLDGKVSLVTAAGGGIAGAIARRFAAEGAKVCCVDINERTVKETVSDIEKEGGAAIAKICNVASETAVLARSQVLLQAGSSILAQANQTPNLALSLLG